ncbi:hypothetical protein DK419_15890 [Methylobacterium terrae]|uniref:Integrase catalytic domain-containing protein n=1 Tax=Methylobacterium terrae TaxID=2202827 RepID=A0A2U8WQP2_9HYPH|nr:hypothetical protein DK419_15890 [Methylobacterium terrae]
MCRKIVGRDRCARSADGPGSCRPVSATGHGVRDGTTRAGRTPRARSFLSRVGAVRHRTGLAGTVGRHRRRRDGEAARSRPWRSFEAVAYATLEWVDRYNHPRLLAPIGSVHSAGAGARYDAHVGDQAFAA